MPSNLGFEARSPRYSPFLVLASVDTTCSESMLFLAIFSLFLGHIMELEGNKGPFVTVRSSRT